MLKKTALGLAIVIIIIVGAFFLISKINAPSSEIELGGNTKDNGLETEEVAPTWVEILAGAAYLRQDGGNLVGLKTGDEIPSGSVVVTDEKGLVIIHLPDGSSLQLDVSSEVRFDEADYDSSSDTLRVKVALTAGRIWSKIIELATPESYWEIKTTNAVAAVRGTAFGMEYAEGETQIIGSENTVQVQPVDPGNGEVINDNVAQVTGNKILSIRHDASAALKAKRIILAKEVRDLAPEFLERPWVKRAILRDRAINQKIEKWLQSGMTRLEARRALRREFAENRRMFLRQLLNRIQQNVSGTVNSLQPADSAAADSLMVIDPAAKDPIGGQGVGDAAAVPSDNDVGETTTSLSAPINFQPLVAPLNFVGAPASSNTNSSSPIAPVTNYVQ